MSGDESHYTRLRHVATLNPPVPVSVRMQLDTELSFLPMEAIHEYGGYDESRKRPVRELLSGYSYFEDGDILFAKVTPCFENGKAAVITGLEGGRGFGTTEVTVVRPGKTVDARFLFYVLIENRFNQLGQSVMTGAGGLKRVPDSFTKNFKFWLPNKDEQGAISNFIDHETAEIDAFIADQKELIGLLNERRAATITRAVTQGLDPDAPLRDSNTSWVGYLREEWALMPLKRHLNGIEQGVSPEASAELADDSSVGVLKAGCVNYGVFRDTEHKRLPEGYQYDSKIEVSIGDLLVNRASGSPDLVGSAAIVEELRYKLILSDKTFRLRTHPRTSPRFLEKFFHSSVYRAQVKTAISGAEGLANNLPSSALKQFLVPTPSLEEQIAIADYIDQETEEIDAAITDAREAIDLSLERRAALISAAVTGKIDVRDWSGSKERVLESHGVA